MLIVSSVIYSHTSTISDYLSNDARSVRFVDAKVAFFHFYITEGTEHIVITYKLVPVLFKAMGTASLESVVQNSHL